MAKAATKSKSKASDVRVPQSRAEAADFVKKIGQASREITRIEAVMNNEIATAKQAAEMIAAPLTAGIASMTKGLQTWCEAHRDELTNGGKVKHAQLGTGKVLWRLLPASVKFAKGTKVEDIVAWCEAQPKPDGVHSLVFDFTAFVRIKKEVDKEAMLGEPDMAGEIPGVKIASDGEQFEVAPFEAQIEGGAA